MAEGREGALQLGKGVQVGKSPQAAVVSAQSPPMSMEGIVSYLIPSRAKGLMSNSSPGGPGASREVTGHTVPFPLRVSGQSSKG